MAARRAGARRPGIVATALLLAIAAGPAWWALAPRPARADGAFPDGQSLLAPAAWPQELVLATNFGVVFSQDGGTTWLWTCEQTGNSFGYLYQMSAPPRHRILALATSGLVYSDDATCTWRTAGGALVGQELADFWVDRTRPDRVLAIGVHCCAGTDRIYSLFQSSDGGSSFAVAPLYVAAAGDVITGVESSASQPDVVYLTLSVGAAGHATLAHSADAGLTWQAKDLSRSLGRGGVKLIAVDSQSAQKVFLLWSDPVLGDELAVTEDGGDTATIRLPAAGDGRVIRGFVRTASGALLVATDRNGVGGLHRSRDAGKTFEELPSPPSLRGFAERGGTLYGATNDFGDGYALATSTDDGTSWVPRFSFDEVQAVPACARVACRGTCEMLSSTLWSASVCSNDAPHAPSPPPPSTDGGADAGRAVIPAPATTGRGCDVMPSGGAPSELSLALAVVLMAMAMRRERRDPIAGERAAPRPVGSSRPAWRNKIERAAGPRPDRHGRPTRGWPRRPPR